MSPHKCSEIARGLAGWNEISAPHRGTPRPSVTAQAASGVVVTTSWDDGHALDGRLADLLDRRGVHGTFYVPLRNPERPVLLPPDLRTLSKRFEIGAHTGSHVNLTKLRPDELWSEVREAKMELEALLGHRVTAFCYPGGKFSRRARAAVARAGFTAARTTMALRWDWGIDPLLLPTSLQVYPHTRLTHARHAVKEGNWQGGANFVRLGAGRDWVGLALRLLELAVTTGGWWHLWGHSWEIEELGAWRQLDDVLAEAGSCGARKVTNTEFVGLIPPVAA